ncbi:MAG: putative 2-dehydropantoate 2-reductase [Planctomycetota bacterium]
MKNQSYAVLGAGAVGGLYGAMLARAGHDVHFLLRSDYEHVRSEGFEIESRWGDFRLPKPKVYRDPEEMPACDVTLVGLKTVQNHLLPDMLRSTSGDQGVVLVLQNGLGVESMLAETMEPSRILGGCCFLCSNKVGPGHIRHIDYGRIVFGPFQTDEKTLSIAKAIEADLNEAGIDAEMSSDLNRVRWRKLMWNIPFNGLSVALDASTDKMIADADSVELVRDIITEVHAAGVACGADIGTEWIEKTIEHTRTMVPYDSSMRLDFLAGRTMELDSIFGVPLQRAAAAGVEMPKTQMLLQVLRFMEKAKEQANQAARR